MYLWPGDEKTQNEQIGNMRARGPAITVALFYLGMNDLGGGKATVDFSGRYVDLANNGKVISPTTVTFDCFATGARFRASDEPPAADAAPGDAPSPGGSGAPGGSGGS